MKTEQLDYMWLASYEDQLEIIKRTISHARLKSVVHNQWSDVAFFEGDNKSLFLWKIDNEMTREQLRDMAREHGIGAPDKVPSLDYYIRFVNSQTGRQSEDNYSLLYEDIQSLRESEAERLGAQLPEEITYIGEWRGEKSDK